MDSKTELCSVLSIYMLNNAKIGSEISRENHVSLVKIHHHEIEYHGRKLNNFPKCKKDKKLLKSLCDLLANLRHPNIIQFIGTCYSLIDTAPVLVNEALPFTVASALEYYFKFPESVHLSILIDVARALVFLHSQKPIIVHGDITARSVFLTRGLQAKIGELGVARLFDFELSAKSLEAAAYIAPEIVDHLSSSPFGDVFSFGVLALHISCGKCPVPKAVESAATSDFDRRRQFVDSLRTSDRENLIPLVRSCLSNDPTSRPTSFQLLQKCQQLAVSTPLPFITALELIQRMERREGELMAVVERLEVEQNEIAGIGKQLNSYGKQLTAVKEQMKTMEKELADSIHDVPFHHEALSKILLPQKDTNRTNVMLDERDHSTPHLRTTQTAFQWKSSSRAPIGMRGATSVVLEGKLYIGGGESKDFLSDCILYEYDTNGLVHKWTALPSCPMAYFALGIVNRSLVLIGGMDILTRQPSSHLFLWDREKQNWSPSLPKMPTARQHPSASMYDLLLIVAGGYRSKEVVANVEVFDQATFQWQIISSLPVPCSGATSCIVRDVLYVMGGNLYGDSGPQTTVQALQLSNPVKEMWKLCKDAPLTLSCAVPASNFILSVGGSYPGSTVPNKAIYVYFPSLDRWELLCKMSTARHSCTASVLSAGKLFIYGGKEETTHPIEYGDSIELLLV